MVKKRGAVFVLSALLTFSVSAFGGFTPVLQSGEPNHAQILGDIYGDGTPFIGQGLYLGQGAWSEFLSPGGSLIARRVNDFVDDVPVPTDQVWACSSPEVFAKAKYAGLEQSFGWNQGGTLGGNYDELLNEDDIGNPGVLVGASGDFLWGIQPGPYEFWSKRSENPDLKDHMVTYQIEPYSLASNLIAKSETRVWLLCFEDLPSRHWQCDWDYNDFLVEVHCTAPEPTTIALLGFGALSLLRRKKILPS